MLDRKHLRRKCFLWVNEASCKALGMLRLSRKAVYKNQTIYTFMSRKKITQVIPNIIPADMMLHCYFVQYGAETRYLVR